MTEDVTASERARIVTSDAGFSVSSVERDQRGRAHKVFRVETTDGVLYTKISGSPRPRFATEAAALQALEQTEISSPQLVASGSDYLVTRSLGTNLRPIAADDEAAWRAFGEWLRSLHALEPAGFGLRYDTDPLPLGQRLSTSLERVAADLPMKFAKRAEQVRDELAAMDLPASFIHRDLRADNILVCPDGRLSGVVDFEHAAGAAPAWDLVKALDWNRPSRAARDAFEQAYGPLPDREVFRTFEALTLLSRPAQRGRYGPWALEVLG